MSTGLDAELSSHRVVGAVSAADPAADAVTITGLTKVHGQGPAAVVALRSVSLAVPSGALTAIMGPSGSGKSTLLHCLAGLDRPTEGSIRLGETELTTLTDRQLTLLRRDRLGFVFQAYNLVPTLTAEQNIGLPLRLAGRRPDPGWLAEIVARTGLSGRLAHRPAELSGGSSSGSRSPGH